MDKYYEVSPETIKTFMDIYDSKSFAFDVKFDFVGCSKQKSMIKLTAVPERYSYKIEKDISVSINEEVMDLYEDDEMVTILIEQELDKICSNLSTGKITVTPLTFITSPGMVNKYGVDKVGRANNVDELTISRNDSI